jgi:serine/threonine protein phosphatase 1
MQPQQSWHLLSRALPAGERVYAIGDIHGCDDLLTDLLDRIALDRRLRSIGRATLVYLGDYVDRGPKSKQVVTRVLQNPGWADQVVRILGNHEALFLDALQKGVNTSLFLKSGGMETLASYGLASGLPPLRLAGQIALLDGALEKIPGDHLALLESGVDRFVIGEHYFCHAGVRPGVPLARQTTADLQGIRREFLESKVDFGVLVVHGHTKVEAPDVRTNRVNVDTGAHTSGRLTCGVFEDNRVRFITTGIATSYARMPLRVPAN